MERKEGSKALGRAAKEGVSGSHSLGKTGKIWRQCAEEDLATLSTEDAEPMERDSWK